MTETCTKCNGEGWVVDFKVKQKHPFKDMLYEHSTPCDCGTYTPYHQRATSIAIPERYSSCKLDNFKQREDITYSKIHVAPKGSETKKATDFTWTVDRLEFDYFMDFYTQNRNLIIEGDSGVGKTHLAVGILKKCIQLSGESGRMVSWHGFTQAIYNRIKDYNLPDPMNDILNVPYLLIDDFLCGNQEQRIPEDKFESLISHRYNRRLTTLITTSYTDYIKGTTKLMPDDLTFFDRVGGDIWGKLYQDGDMVLIDGSNYRYKDKGDDDNLDDVPF